MTIVSFEHGFLFIKTRKVAGTSVEAVLRSVTGGRDIVTPLTPKDEGYCASLGLHAQNYARNPAEERDYRALVGSGDYQAALAYNRNHRKRYGPHMPAVTLARRLGRRTFAGLYRFSIERNPFSWLVSIATHDTRSYNAGDPAVLDADAIRSRLISWLSRHRGMDGSNYDFYTLRGRLAVDRVLRYESLADDLDDVLRHLNLVPTLPLPRLKVSPDVPPLEEIYTPALEAEVVERFRPVFELMGYPREIVQVPERPDRINGASVRRSTDRSMSPRTEEPAGRPCTSD